MTSNKLQAGGGDSQMNKNDSKKTKTGKAGKNVSILTTISGLAGYGAVQLVNYLSQAIASGAYEPTAALYQGVIGIALASAIGLFYAKTGVTSLPLDDGELHDIVENVGEAANRYENTKTK